MRDQYVGSPEYRAYVADELGYCESVDREHIQEDIGIPSLFRDSYQCFWCGETVAPEKAERRGEQ